jgi:hypothetical protein
MIPRQTPASDTAIPTKMSTKRVVSVDESGGYFCGRGCGIAYP